jgi:hypothetical protein
MLEHWTQGLQIGFPNSMYGILFFSLGGQYKAIKAQHLLVTWGQISSWIQPRNVVRHNSLLCVSTRNPETLNPKPRCLFLVKLFVQTLACFLCPFFVPLLTNLKVFKGLGFASLVYVYLLLALAFHCCKSQILSSCKPDGEIITL